MSEFRAHLMGRLFLYFAYLWTLYLPYELVSFVTRQWVDFFLYRHFNYKILPDRIQITTAAAAEATAVAAAIEAAAVAAEAAAEK